MSPAWQSTHSPEHMLWKCPWMLFQGRWVEEHLVCQERCSRRALLILGDENKIQDKLKALFCKLVKMEWKQVKDIRGGLRCVSVGLCGDGSFSCWMLWTRSSGTIWAGAIVGQLKILFRLSQFLHQVRSINFYLFSVFLPNAHLIILVYYMMTSRFYVWFSATFMGWVWHGGMRNFSFSTENIGGMVQLTFCFLLARMIAGLMYGSLASDPSWNHPWTSQVGKHL